ncbi:MAG: T9SS type A sorting domain-containing protein [bacterium]|nr:T9SS type A sorting domain-containing protein [bacterium]
MNEITILDAESKSQGKTTRYVNMQVVDLASGRVRSRTDAVKPLVYPNPASTEIRVIPPVRSMGSSTLRVDMVDGLGRIVATWSGDYTSVVVIAVEQIPSGMYSVRTTWASGEQASVTVAIQR